MTWNRLRATRPARALTLSLLLAALAAPTATAGTDDLVDDPQEILDTLDDDIVTLTAQLMQNTREVGEGGGDVVDETLTDLEDNVRQTPSVTAPVVDGVRDTVIAGAATVNDATARAVAMVHALIERVRAVNHQAADILDAALDEVLDQYHGRMGDASSVTSAALSPLPGVVDDALDAVNPPDPEGSPPDLVDGAKRYAEQVASAAKRAASHTLRDAQHAVDEVSGA